MRKLTFLLLLSISSFAQTQKGNFSFGTRAINYQGFNNQTRLLNFEPSAGYFIGNNLEVGLGIHSQVIWVRDSQYNYQWSNASSIAVLPYITKYFARGKFQPFISASGGLEVQSMEYNSGSIGVIGLAVGVQYFLVKNIALGFHTGVTTGRYADTFGAGLNFAIYIPSKKE